MLARPGVFWCKNAIAGPSRIPICLSPSCPPTIPIPVAGRYLSTSSSALSGHNRWSKIRHRKGAADAQKSALFSRLTNDIHIALRPPNSNDPIVNTKLALAMAKAKDAGVPRSSIDNCFARAKAAAEGTGQIVHYEAVGPSGKEALIVECLTDNPSRTVKRVKEILHRNNCRIAPVAYLFEKTGLIAVRPSEGSLSPSPGTFDELFDIAVEVGAQDVRDMSGEDGLEWHVITPIHLLSEITNILSSPTHSSSYTIQSSEIAFLPTMPLDVLAEGETSEGESISEEKAEGIAKVVGLLEEDTDVVRVWTNLVE